MPDLQVHHVAGPRRKVAVHKEHFILYSMLPSTQEVLKYKYELEEVFYETTLKRLGNYERINCGRKKSPKIAAVKIYFKLYIRKT